MNIKVTYAGQTYSCIKAVREGDRITLYMTDGSTVEFIGVSETAWEKFQFEDGNWYQPPLDEIKTSKIVDLSAACNAAIVAGMDVQTSQGTEHFSLEETDQINLTTALTAVQAGAADYPYHADGQLCRMFTAAEIQAIAQASVQHKLYHTTLCNHLLTWARRAETAEELTGISYTADNLPEELATNMAEVLASASSL